MRRSFILKCTCIACRSGARHAKRTRRGVRRVSKVWKYYRRQLRRKNAHELRNGRYEAVLLSFPYTD